MSLYFVFLRQPRKTEDRRDDPFWEAGSFGRTGCHGRNLMNRNRSPLREGDRLAFLQGGDDEIRVVGLTPEITTAAVGTRLEALWDEDYRPAPYAQAPILIRNDHYTDFPAILPFLANTARSTPVGAAASRFRARTQPMSGEIARQILAWFQRREVAAAERYIEAVASPASRWFEAAAAKDWSDLDVRLQRYEDMGPS
jgi:hypothetical protein